MDRNLYSSSSWFGHSSCRRCNEAVLHNSAVEQHDPRPCTGLTAAWSHSPRTVAKVDGSGCERRDGGRPESVAGSVRRNTCPSNEDGCSW